MSEFVKLLDLNSQLATPKGLCLTCWSLVSETQYKTHEGQHGHRMAKADLFPSKETFIQLAVSHGKARMDANQTTVAQIQLPLSAPTPVLQMTVQDGPSALSNSAAQSHVSNIVDVDSYNPNTTNLTTTNLATTVQPGSMVGGIPHVQSMHPQIDIQQPSENFTNNVDNNQRQTSMMQSQGQNS